jgi:excisionase family DNA binding protein
MSGSHGISPSPGQAQTSQQMSAPLDAKTRRLLRLLGEAALQLADGHAVDTSQLERFMSAGLPDNAQELLLTVPEACARLRISRWSFYHLLHQNRLRSVMIGRRRYVKHVELNRFVVALSEDGVAV